MKVFVFVFFGFVLLFVPLEAEGQYDVQLPEITANLALGGGGVFRDETQVDKESQNEPRYGVFRMGLNTSFTFFRASNREFGFGFYSEVMTSTFQDVMPGMGLSFLIPIHHAAPLIIQAGGHYDFDGEHAGGFGGRLWWGAHNHNHFAMYNSTFGLWVEVRANIWGNNDILVAGGIDIDLHIMASPFLWLAAWARGPSGE